LHIGIDICCLIDDASDDEHVNFGENVFIHDGILGVSDYFFSIDNMIAYILWLLMPKPP